jgi:hypothetical protein
MPSNRRPGALANAAAILLLLAPWAGAVPLHYELGSGSVSANLAEPGLVIDTAVKSSLPGTSFVLNDNSSFSFQFFDIWTNERTINSDDLVVFPVSATLTFLDPVTASSVTGISVGGSWFKGLSQWGQLTWDGPVTVSLANDRAFQISLTDATFNYGFGGLNEGMVCGATISATVTQLTSVLPTGGNPTPTPGSNPTPTPGGNPTPTPGGNPTPTPGGNPTPTPGDSPTPRPVLEPTPPGGNSVPEGGETVILLGTAMGVLGVCRLKLRPPKG